MLTEQEWKSFNRLIDLALEEDIGIRGDITSEAIFGKERCTCKLVSKDYGILAGIECFHQVFQRIDPEVEYMETLEDGVELSPGMVVTRLTGPTKSILKAERTALNFVGYLSGIATATHRMVLAARDKGKTVILDTRKTLPGYRALAKYAVRVGGGKNHRFGLYDMVLIKDNHIAAAGGITHAVARVRAYNQAGLPIEVEVKSLEELEEALAIQPPLDRIMLDNMDLETMRRAVEMTAGRVPLEASGGVSLERVRAIAETGVDYISVGALTHSVKALDISLEVEPL